MVDSPMNTPVSQQDLQKLLTSDLPKQEATVPKVGTSTFASRDDHTHARLSSSQRYTLDANGQAVVTYAMGFDAAPGIILTAINPSGRQIVLEVVSDTIVNSQYTGCVVRGSRATALPTLAPVSGLLTAVITGINTIAGSLSGYELFVPAASAQISVVAIKQSAVAP